MQGNCSLEACSALRFSVCVELKVLLELMKGVFTGRCNVGTQTTLLVPATPVLAAKGS